MNMASVPTEWHRDGFLISTALSLIQPAEINAAFGSEAVYWAKPMDESLLKKMLQNSLCFGVYELATSSTDTAGRHNLRQIGLARLITDEVSFAYLTDVYILEEYQSKGLGSWLINCVDETLTSWPELRRAMLITSGAQKFYANRLGMKVFESGKNGLVVLNRRGGGSVFKD